MRAHFVVVLLVSACATTSSSQVATNQIKPDYSVVVDTYQNGSTYIGAILAQDGSLSNVRLVAGDNIVASTEKDPSIALAYDGTLQVYSTTLDKVVDRTMVTIALTRASGVPAPASSVTIPPAIAITAPVAMAQIPFANGTGSVQFTWSNSISGGKIGIAAFPSCDGSALQASTLTTQGPDSGSLTVPTSKLIVNAPPAGGQCILLRIAREVNGTLDPAYASGGKFTGDRFDYLKLVMMP